LLPIQIIVHYKSATILNCKDLIFPENIIVTFLFQSMYILPSFGSSAANRTPIRTRNRIVGKRPLFSYRTENRIRFVRRPGAAFTKCFYNSSMIFLRFFYDNSLRAFTVFSAQNPSQLQQGKSFPEFGMHQILLQFFHKIAVESLFPY
jgi:hypothetical protein